MNYLGDFPDDATVYMTFNTFDSNDPSASVTITDLIASDVEVYKAGVIQTTPGAGVTITLNLGTGNGSHLIAVDASNVTDGGFYVTGAEYQVRINGTTVDGATINAWVGSFSIERAGGVIALLKLIQAATITNAQGADVATDVAAMIDGSNRVDVGSWLGQAVTLSTNNKPDVNIDEISDDTTAASNLELFTEVLENATGLIDAGTFKAGAIDAAAIANAAIDNATFAADVGSTAYATNIIALAVRKALDEINLDTLAGVDTGVAADGDLSGHVITGSVLAHIMAANKDVTTSYNASTDSLEAIRNHIGDGTNLTEAGGDGDHLTEAGGDGDHLTAINLPNQTMDIIGSITGNLSGSVGSVTGHTNQTGDSFARLAAPAGASVSADIAAVKVDTAASKTVTDNLADSATTLQSGTVSHDNTPATTTVFFSDDITEATADHYNGRIVIFTSGALQYQATDITDYALDTGEGKFTVTALTEAPGDNVTFVIV